MLGKGLVSRILSGTKTLTSVRQQIRPYYALAFSSKNGSNLKLTSGLLQDEKDLLIRCGGDKKKLEALKAAFKGELDEVDRLLTDKAEGLVDFEIDSKDNGVIMWITDKGAKQAAERDAKIRENSPY